MTTRIFTSSSFDGFLTLCGIFLESTLCYFFESIPPTHRSES